MADSPAESPAESTSNSPLNSPNTTTTVTITTQQKDRKKDALVVSNPLPAIETEFVSDDEMAVIDAALSSVSSIIRGSSPRSFPQNARSISSITRLSKRRFSSSVTPDIEDSGRLTSSQKRNPDEVSLIHRFRRRGLYVTDITGAEWCEKQMENYLRLGRRKVSSAMKVGLARHLELEEEVVKRIKVRTESIEDMWALRLLGSITGVNQLLFEGLTRELPLVSFVAGAWMTGVIDEVRMPLKDASDRSPILVDTKTRHRGTLPSEPQRRNGKLQLMMYKLLLDGLVANEFPSRQFFNYFSLNPHGILSQDIRDNIATAGLPAQTLEDILSYYINTWKTLPLANDELLLRYEFQNDQSLLAEVSFEYDPDWLTSKLQEALEFWRGEREARFTSEEERWKCRFCQYASHCPANPHPDVAKPSSPSRTSRTRSTS